MVTSVNEGMYTEMDSAGTPIQGIRDTNDFIHSGIIKGLSAGIRGHYAIKNGAYNGSVGFEIVQGNSGGKTTLAVAAGKVFRDGAYNSVATVTFTANSSPSTFDEPSSGTSYFMIVADASNVLKIRGDKANTNSLPVNKHTSSSATDILTGDVPIAIVKMANGGTVDARPIQFLTTDQDEKTVTIGHTTTNAFVEAMSISSTASVTTFENKVSDADIVFQVKDGSSASQEVLRIDAAAQRIGINASSPSSDLHIDSSGVTELRVSSTQDTNYSVANIICHTINDYRGSGLYISADDDSGDAQDQTWAIGTAYSKDDLQIGFYQDKYDDVVNSANDPLDPTQGVVRITTGGNVGIGLFDGGDTPSAPEYMLHLVSMTDQRPQLMLENRNTDENAGNEPEIIFKRQATPSAEGDHDSFDIGNIKWNARDHNGNYLTFCQVMGDIVDDSDGSEDGRLVFYMQAGGTNSEHFRVGGGAVTVNSQGLSNIDFIVESDTYNVINVDASNDSISIGGNDSAKIGFYGATPIVCATVSAGDIASSPEAVVLATALSNLGLINVA